MFAKTRRAGARQNVRHTALIGTILHGRTVEFLHRMIRSINWTLSTTRVESIRQPYPIIF